MHLITSWIINKVWEIPDRIRKTSNQGVHETLEFDKLSAWLTLSPVHTLRTPQAVSGNNTIKIQKTLYSKTKKTYAVCLCLKSLRVLRERVCCKINVLQAILDRKAYDVRDWKPKQKLLMNITAGQTSNNSRYMSCQISPAKIWVDEVKSEVASGNSME